MKPYKLTILLFFFISFFMSIDSFAQRKADTYIELYKEHIGGNTWNWIAENINDVKAITFKIKYDRGGDNKKRWNESFTLKPGEIKTIGTQYTPGKASVYAYVKSAKFVKK